jgi:hypothetical protein
LQEYCEDPEYGSGMQAHCPATCGLCTVTEGDEPDDDFHSDDDFNDSEDDDSDHSGDSDEVPDSDSDDSDSDDLDGSADDDFDDDGEDTDSDDDEDANIVGATAGAVGGLLGLLVLGSVAVCLERRYKCAQGRSWSSLRFWAVRPRNPPLPASPYSNATATTVSI